MYNLLEVRDIKEQHTMYKSTHEITNFMVLKVHFNYNKDGTETV